MPRKGEPLDEFLTRTEHTLSDAEMDHQLYRAAEPRDKSAERDFAANQKPPALRLNELFANIEAAQEKRELVDVSVKTASHGVKVLAPLLTAVSRWIDPKADGDKIETIMGSVLARVRQDAQVVAGAYGVSADDAPPWLTSQISGQIMQVLIDAIDRNNGIVIEDRGDLAYLAPLVNLAQQAGGIEASPYANPGDPNWQLANTLMLASSAVMTEYHAFNYFHGDARLVAQQISDYLTERVVDGTLANLTERFDLNTEERAYFGCSLLKGAGRLLADAWTRNMAAITEEIKRLPFDARREVLLSGYPLDPIFEDFESMYQGLEVSSESAIRSLAPHRERPMQSHDNATSFSPR